MEALTKTGGVYEAVCLSTMDHLSISKPSASDPHCRDNEQYQFLYLNHQTTTMSADNRYEQQNDMATGADVPAGDAVDNDYVSRTGQKQYIPVQKDGAPVEDPIDPATADSDQQLGESSSHKTSWSCDLRKSMLIQLCILTERDDADAIDKSNIVEGRTRGTTKQAGTYREPGDEEGLPGADDGTSRQRTEGVQDPSLA
jgi:hypothetical protein